MSPPMAEPDSCCKKLAASIRAGYIARIEDRCHLGNQFVDAPPASASTGVVYGPRIRFCPFCGHELAPAS